jgi:hypothetical protein
LAIKTQPKKTQKNPPKTQKNPPKKTQKNRLKNPPQSGVLLGFIGFFV